MVICGREISSDVMARLNASGEGLSRRQLSRELCQWLDWRGPAGTWQTSMARLAIQQLERRGLLKLPARASPLAGRRKSTRVRAQALELPPIGGSLRELGPVELVLVGHRDSQVARQSRQLLERTSPIWGYSP
ncbi:MAG: hypothetical protein WCO56_13005 [Verrucomicrobiota bacterium]